MFEAVKNEFEGKEFMIMSAAVADYKPVSKTDGKIKKSAGNIEIKTEKTVDILEYLGKNKGNCKLIGFALETDSEVENAIKKLEKKNLDLIISNSPKVEGAGFGTDTNVATLIDKNKKVTKLDKMSKFDLSNIILTKMQEKL
jgi:phosphopantothenoylcysteine decarboxylase/phosphopantothenate--cysteine ligase